MASPAHKVIYFCFLFLLCLFQGNNRHGHRLNSQPQMLIKKPIEQINSFNYYDSWSPWSTCSGSCGIGHRKRFKNCISPSSNCTRTLYEVEKCQLPDCSDLFRRQTHAREVHGTGNEEWMGTSFSYDQYADYSKNGPTNCTNGYSWDLLRQTCTDIDECKRKKTCPQSHRCVNTLGSFRSIKCPAGFAGVKERCLDINECSQKKHNCKQICVNLPGSFACQCQRYYELQPDGFSCYPSVLQK